MMTGFRYEPEECSHENADVVYVQSTPAEKVPVVRLCPDCGLKGKVNENQK